jgi:hypothetical protein
MSHDNSVSKVTGYDLDGGGIIPERENYYFFQLPSPEQFLGTPSLITNGYRSVGA